MWLYVVRRDGVMALVKCPECGKEISDSALACPHCGCPSDIIKEKIELKKIEDAKPKMVKACSCCGLIIWNKDALGYQENYCLECDSRNIPHNLVELPILCEDFENKLYIKKNESDAEIHKYIDSIRAAEREIYENYVEKFETLDMSTETWNLNMESLYNNGKGIAHDAVANRVASQIRSESIGVKYTPKCPICDSPNIKKISGITKAGSVAMWGIFSRKVHKQWHCNNCGSEW